MVAFLATVPERKPFLKRRATVFRKRMRPVPWVRRRLAFEAQLSADQGVGGGAVGGGGRESWVVEVWGVCAVQRSRPPGTSSSSGSSDSPGGQKEGGGSAPRDARALMFAGQSAGAAPA